MWYAIIKRVTIEIKGLLPGTLKTCTQEKTKIRHKIENETNTRK